MIRTDEKELQEKINFINELKKVFKRYSIGIEDLNYEVFENNGDYTEYLTLKFEGGALSARNCTGDSLSAILSEIARLSNGGYYEENDWYATLESKYPIKLSTF